MEREFLKSYSFESKESIPDSNLVNGQKRPETKESRSERWKSVDQTVRFIQDNWKGFFHTHAQESGKFTPESEKNYFDLCQLFQTFLKMDFHGVSPHLEKVYPEDVVINPKSIDYHIKKFQKERLERGRIEKEIPIEAMKRYLRLKEYHKPEEIHKAWEEFRQIDQESAEKVLKGAECDIKVKEESEGSFSVQPFTPLEKIKKLGLDYLIISVHPDTDPLVLKNICQNSPEKLTELYLKISKLAQEVSQSQGIRVIIGHPLSRCEARKNLTLEQKEIIIKSFTEAGVSIEISLNDYYMKGRKAKIKDREGKEEIIKGEKALMEEFIPMMEKEFLELIKKYELKITVDTDLHFGGGWIRDRGGMEKLGKQLEDLYNKPSFLALPRFIRSMMARFVRVVQRLLEAGIKSENILNTWDKQRIIQPI